MWLDFIYLFILNDFVVISIDVCAQFIYVYRNRMHFQQFKWIYLFRWQIWRTFIACAIWNCIRQLFKQNQTKKKKTHISALVTARKRNSSDGIERFFRFDSKNHVRHISIGLPMPLVVVVVVTLYSFIFRSHFSFLPFEMLFLFMH